ncbi:replication-relaxation family protein [Arthrobacter sp. RAF14]|uniref:replication-relaxation family protein n=1 Tax=Arthrobacter sp. RAF14 TaxID=3233051 RepID=UPI003F8F3687
MSELHPLPLGYPPASGSTKTSSNVNGKTPTARETKSGNLPVPTPAQKKRISKRRLQAIATVLSDRDHAILGTIDTFRFATGAHLVKLHFAAHASSASAERTARRVLARLREIRVLDVLEQRIGGIRAGSDGLVYFLGPVGDRVIRQSHPTRPRRRLVDPSTRFLQHTLAITEVAAAMHEKTREHGGEVVSLVPEKPRSFTDLLGTRQVVKPDLSTELAGTPGAEDIAAFFIEVDLGTESIPTLVGKCLSYEEYRRSGEEQRRFGGFPVIVWAMTAARPQTAARRRQDLARALERHPKISGTDYRIVALETAPADILKEVSHA